MIARAFLVFVVLFKKFFVDGVNIGDMLWDVADKNRTSYTKRSIKRDRLFTVLKSEVFCGQFDSIVGIKGFHKYF